MLVARVGDRLIGLPLGEIAQVLPMMPLWRPPTLPAPVRGFLTMHGIALPVLDGHALLGLGAGGDPGVYSHILELRTLGRRPAGLLVDRAEGFTSVAAFGALDAECSLNGCATAIFQYRGEALAYRIEIDRLLGAAEQEALALLTEEAERRRGEWQVAA